MGAEESPATPSESSVDIIDERYGYAATFFLLGLSLVVLSFGFIGDPKFLPTAAGGWLLIGFSESLLAGRMTFEPWISFPNRRVEWLGIVIGVLFAISLVAISLWILLN